MTVFKGYCLLMKRNIRYMIVYLGIFIFLMLLIQVAFESEKKESDFQATKLRVTVLDEDGGVLAEGLKSYLGAYHELVDLENDTSVLQEAMYYRNTEYVVFIPEDFEKTCIQGGSKLVTTKLPGSYSGFYADQQINTFLNGANVYLEAGYTAKEASAMLVNETKEKAQVHLLDAGSSGGAMTAYFNFFHYLPYLLIAVICYAMSIAMIAYCEPMMKKRMQCSAVSATKQNMQVILASLLAGVGFWAVCVMLPVLIYGKEFLAEPNLCYYFLNSFVCMLVGLSLSFIIGSTAKNTTVLNGMVNVVSLGLSFLGGVFVPKEIMGTGILKVAQFLPTYWYEEVNDILGSYRVIPEKLVFEIWKGMGIQLLFAVACISVTLAAIRMKENR